MFGLEILDVALGLVLTYLLLSLILTSAREALEARLKTRGRDLERAIGELLQGDSKLVTKFYDHPLVYALHRGQRPGASLVGTSAAPVVENAATPAAKPSAKSTISGLNPKDLPSYIPRETFTAALLDMVSNRGESNAQLTTALVGLQRLSGEKPERFRRELEGWYDAAMDRASGWYKRRTQKVLFAASLVLAVVLNINSIAIGRHLAIDEQSRAYADRLAATIIERGGAQISDLEGSGEFRDALLKSSLPVGWNRAVLNRLGKSLTDEKRAWADNELHWDDGAYLVQCLAVFIGLLAGYAITAFALMLGAPFWFDVLNRIMVIRSTVKPTEKSPDEPSEEGGRAPPKNAVLDGDGANSAPPPGPAVARTGAGKRKAERR